MKLPVMGTCISFSLTFFFSLLYFLRLGYVCRSIWKSVFFFSHDISIVVRCPCCLPFLLLLPKTKKKTKKSASKGFKNIYCSLRVDQIVMIDEVQRFSPPLPYLCDKRCSVASPVAPPRVCVCACVCLRGR